MQEEPFRGAFESHGAHMLSLKVLLSSRPLSSCLVSLRATAAGGWSGRAEGRQAIQAAASPAFRALLPAQLASAAAALSAGMRPPLLRATEPCACSCRVAAVAVPRRAYSPYCCQNPAGSSAACGTILLAIATRCCSHAPGAGTCASRRSSSASACAPVIVQCQRDATNSDPAERS